ncbi:MAG: hypothetical protein R3A46_15010 [Thermomicrobiales bacterium]
MITFHGGRMAPDGLCALLYQTIPKEFHVPIVFVNRSPEGDQSSLGICSDTRVTICLNRIFSETCQHPIGSLAFSLWYETLRVCYHEFGHVATRQDWQHISQRAYDALHREYFYIERLADEWAERKLLELRDHELRLVQPRSCVATSARA